MKAIRCIILSIIACFGLCCPACVTADNAPACQDDMATSAPVYEYDDIKKEVISMENDLTSLQSEVDSLNSTVCELQEKGNDSYSKLELILLIISIILICFTAYMFMCFAKVQKHIAKMQIEINGSKNCIAQNHSLIVSFKNKLNEVEDNLESIRSYKEVEVKKDPTANTKQLLQSHTTSTNQFSSNATSDTHKSIKIQKYVDFSQDSDGAMKVLPRSVSDESNGKWFVISYKESDNKASYSINPECKQVMLSDLNSLQLCVKRFQNTTGAHDIKVLSPGTLVKKGNGWEISEKLTIELV